MNTMWSMKKLIGVKFLVGVKFEEQNVEYEEVDPAGADAPVKGLSSIESFLLLLADVYYSKNKEAISSAPPDVDLPPLFQLVSSHSSPKSYFYVLYGGQSYGFEIGFCAVKDALKKLQMSKVLQERGFESLPSSTETNLRDQVKSISTTIKVDASSIRRIGSSQYAVSTGQNSTLLYKSRQTTVPFPSRLDNHYYEEDEGNYGPKFTEAYGASHINDTIP
ncbi:hypothetical protein Tco_0426350 [Tanacetum coccineum]